eukprot:13596387-Alexandrium_andersonii.AAC.1
MRAWPSEILSPQSACAIAAFCFCVPCAGGSAEGGAGAACGAGGGDGAEAGRRGARGALMHVRCESDESCNASVMHACKCKC